MPCRACKLDIADGAWKCVHCGTIQDWRRYLNFSSTILSLLVALVSVSTVLVPIVAAQFNKTGADIRVVSLSDGALTIIARGARSSGQARAITGLSYPIRPTIAFVNAGTRLGLLVEICLDATVRFDGTAEVLSRCHNFDGDEALLHAGETWVFRPSSELLLQHSALPAELAIDGTAEQSVPIVGPLSITGAFTIAFQNEIGTTSTAVLPLDLEDVSFVGYAAPRE